MAEGGGLKRHMTGPALGMLAIGLVLTLTVVTELPRQIELKTLDLRFRARPALQQSPLLLHVDIDDSSLKSFGRWQWPRIRHAHLLDILHELGARAVLFDIEFLEPSTPTDDNAFAAALQRTHFSFLPFRLDAAPPATPEDLALRKRIRQSLHEDFMVSAIDLSIRLNAPQKKVEERFVSLKKSVAQSVGWEILQARGTLTRDMLLQRLIPEKDRRFRSAEKEKMIPAAVDHCLSVKRVYEKSAKPLPEGLSPDAFVRVDEVESPIQMLTPGCIGFGASNTRPDTEDGVIRHVSLFFLRKGRLLPHLSLAAACWAAGADVKDLEVVPGRHVIIRPTRAVGGSTEPIVVPVDENCRTIVNWAGSRRTRWSELFRHIAYGSILELHTLREDLDRNGDVFRRNDVYLRGAWTQADSALKKLRERRGGSDEDRGRLEALRKNRRDVEEQMLKFLKRQTSRVTDEQLKTLPLEDRQLINVMKLDQDTIPQVWEARKTLRPRVEHLREKLGRLVKDSLCIVGLTASGTTDIKPTPIHAEFPGVGVHSSAVNSILQRRFVRRVPDWVNVVVIVVTGLLVSFLASYLSTRGAALGSLAVLAGWALTTFLLFWLTGWWVALAAPLAAGFLAYAAITAYRQLTEERQKRHIRNTFHHYLAPTVVAEVLKNPDALKLGGERKDLTVFFSDVAGFTPIAEKMEPEELVQLLNDYLSEMSDVVLQSKGYINKYQGDAIMAVFGAPLYDPENAAAACRVALESQHRLKDFRAKLALEKRPIIRARIGINSGIMIVGNMGSRTLFDYTVMGDNVNIGARLESANKQFGTEIIIGENTFKAVRDTFETRRLGLVHVKGRSKPVGAYELLAEKGHCPPLVGKLLPHYEEGLAAYAEQRWDTAIAAFSECLSINEKDGPSRAYLDRCQHLAEQTGVEHWDGTFTLEK